MKKSSFKFKRLIFTAAISAFAMLFIANFVRPHQELEYEIPESFAVEDPRFPKAIGDLLDPAFVVGNSIETLSNGDEIFPSMLDAIRSAKSTITFESYIYWSGDIGKTFAEALAQRARAGVKVHILLDWAGSQKIADDYLKIMESAGVEIERYHAPSWSSITRMNNRTHRKILVIDGRVGFTGGVGIADEWGGQGDDPNHWRDTHFKVEGPVVNQMQSAFMDNWLKIRPEVHLDEKYFPTLQTQGPSEAQMFISSAGEGGSSARIMYLIAIAGAKKSIYLESAYFVPDAHVIQQLIAAKKRGVDVKIIVPGPYNDSEVADHVSKHLWGDLLKARVEIFEYQPALFHCKVLIIDRYFVSVGSTNFDERSFRINDEANLNILDKNFAETQISLFEKDIKKSKSVSFDEWDNRPLKEKFLGLVGSIFSTQF